LNGLRLRECRIANDEGTDISFSFLPSSSFHSSYMETAGGRMFSPYPVSGDIFRLIDPLSLTGWINISKPISLWGKRIPSLSLRFDGGKVTEYSSSPVAESLLGLYLSQEPTSGRASMVTISEISNPLEDEDLTFIPELDRMRTVSITIGGPKGEAVEEGDIEHTVDSLLSLSLPVGSESTVITALGENGEEYTIYSGGYIMDEEE
ncbi:MAG: aminopeptidase, partial [Candidatus Ornithospirochaeta sp.]